MDITTLKEALGDEKFAELQAHVNDLIGQRDAARSESINGRKKLRDDLAAAQALAAKAMEKLGVDSADDLETLPDAKGQGEAIKQFETRLKRAERERDEAKAAAEAASGKWRGSLQKAAIAEALSGHDFIARDIVETHIASRLVWEGEDLLFKSDDGKLLPVKDGVTGIAKTRPELLKPTGTGGAGVRQSNAGSGGGKTMSEAEFSALPPKERASVMASGYTLTPS
ncbi:MAG: hypothetical protein H6880_11400 [Rhodobiaceae bacterium]|nr:hypothetical protein [Rhodobiaceae bacterium]